MATIKATLTAFGLVLGLAACGQTRQTQTKSAQAAVASPQPSPQSRSAASVIKPAGETRISILPEPSVPWPSIRGVHRFMALHQKKFRRCFSGPRPGEMNVQGRVSVEFVIDNSGEIIEARIGQSSLGNKKVESCIIAVVRGIRFPTTPNGGPITVRYPFALKKSVHDNGSWFDSSTELAYLDSL